METATNRADGARMTVTPVLSRRASSRGDVKTHTRLVRRTHPRITTSPLLQYQLRAAKQNIRGFALFLLRACHTQAWAFFQHFFVDPIGHLSTS